MPRKFRIHKYFVRPGKLSIIELLVLFGPDLLHALFPHGVMTHTWPWIGVNSWLTMLMMTGEVPLIPYAMTLNTNRHDHAYPTWWGAFMDRHGVVHVMERLLYVQSWDVPPEIETVTLDFILLGVSMLDENEEIVPESLEEAMRAAEFILTLSATSITHLSLTVRRDVQPFELWKLLPELRKLTTLIYNGELYTHDVNSDGINLLHN